MEIANPIWETCRDALFRRYIFTEVRKSEMTTSSVISGFSSHFPEIDLGEDDLASMGFSYCSISVFDHWLGEDEASENPLMSYSIASDSGVLEKYLEGEKEFLNFYSSLSDCGVICNRPGTLRKFESINSELEQIFVNSLREKRLMDVYFIGSGVRVIGRYDRTDLIIADTPEQLNSLRAKVVQFGLFVLPA